MTSVVEVSRSEMIAETGIDTAGYAQPKKDRILVLKGLPDDVRKSVLGHEFSHIAKGEEGPNPLLAALIPAFASIAGGIIGSGATGRATNALQAGNQAAIDEQRRQFDVTMSLLNPSIQTGNAARNQLAALFGLPQQSGTGGGGGANANPYADGAFPITGGAYGVPPPDVNYFSQEGGGYGYSTSPGFLAHSPFSGTNRQQPSTGAPFSVQADSALAPENSENFTGTGYSTNTATGGDPVSAEDTAAAQQNALNQFFTSPQFQFNLDTQGRQIEGAAAARGGSLSGGVLRALETNASNLASGEFQNYVGDLLNLASGGTAATGTAVTVNAGTSGNVSNLLQSVGNTRASGILGQTNTLGNTINNIGGILGDADFDWSGLFGGGGDGSGSGSFGVLQSDQNDGLFGGLFGP